MAPTDILNLTEAHGRPSGKGKKNHLQDPASMKQKFQMTRSRLRSDKNGGLNCDIEVGFLSSALPLMANISYRLGRHLKFNGAKEQFENDPEADAMLTREYRKPYIITNQV
jgi:hypothetical protein